MKKFQSRNRALLLALASLLALMTSCITEVDNPVIPTPDPVITETLTGEWFATVNRHDYDEDSDEDEIEYVLFSFDEDGIVTQDVYFGSKTSPLKYWERMHRHGIYTVDESAHSITVENIYDNPSVITYGFDKEQLILQENADMALILHRPSKAEKELLAVYDLSLEGDDYTGKWFGVQEENGQYNYVMLDFTEDSGLKTISYSVNGDECIRTEFTQYYNESDEDEDEDEQVLEIHYINDYSQSVFYQWEVVGNTLTLVKEENEEEVATTYHALTKADVELMAELEKKSNHIDNLAEKIKGKWMMAEVNGQPVVTNSKQVLTYVSDTKFDYSLSITAISDLNVWVNHCEGFYNVNGTILAQSVTLPDDNIKFLQQLNIISITDDEIQLIANNETFVDGQSHRITKNLRERKVRVTHDYSEDIIGTWEGRLTSEQDAYSDDQVHRWEYKADGTFAYYRQNDSGEWVADVNTMAEYFVDGTLLCTRWKNVGDDTEKRESWEIASIKDGKMNWTALRENADGSTYTSQFSMTRVE